MNRLDWVTHSTEALEVEDEMNREWDRKKSKYCCERCGKETDRLQLNSRYGSDFQLCSSCMEHD